MGSVFVLDSHSNQGLVSIRSLGSRGLDVATGSPYRLNGGRFSKYVTRYLTYPDPGTDPDRFVRTICEELGRNDYEMLLPIKEATVQAVGEHRERFEQYTTIPPPSYEKLQLGLDKRRTIDAAREFDVPHPKTVVASETTVDMAGDVLGYPVVVKPAYGDGGRGVSICDSRAELERRLQQPRPDHGSVLLQEWIPNGGERGVYTLYNRSGELSAVTVQHRLRSSPPEGGASTYRETVRDPGLVSLADRFLSALDWQGAAMAEFRIDARTDEPKLMEINPRLWGSLALSVHAGVDFPSLLYRLAVGDELRPDLEYRVGVRARDLFRDLWQVLQREDRARATYEFVTTGQEQCCFDIISSRDPLPTLGQIPYYLNRAASTDT